MVKVVAVVVFIAGVWGVISAVEPEWLRRRRYPGSFPAPDDDDNDDGRLVQVEAQTECDSGCLCCEESQWVPGMFLDTSCGNCYDSARLHKRRDEFDEDLYEPDGT